MLPLQSMYWFKERIEINLFQMKKLLKILLRSKLYIFVFLIIVSSYPVV